MKKIYEEPSVTRYCLNVQDELMEGPTVSNTGYGWDDVGPVNPANG